MSLPKVQQAGFREYEIQGCPLMDVAGLELVSLWRVCEAFSIDRKAACKRLANVKPPRFASAQREKESE